MKVLTTDQTQWNYSKPKLINHKCLLLTSGGVALIGKWGDGEGLIAWSPLPKRNRKIEINE